jgi:glycerol-3-phosphate acyltransferase PlsY
MTQLCAFALIIVSVLGVVLGGLTGTDEASRVVLYERAPSGDWIAWWALFIAIGYVLGSIPFGYLLTRAAGLGDVRSIGSGNIGATNVLRTGRKGLAALTLLLDGLKGFAAVVIARYIGAHYAGLAIDAALLAGLGAFLGHLFPVWLGFSGGKGVATYIGVLFGLNWQAGAAFCVVWLIVAFATRYSSLSALLASLVVPAGLWALGDNPVALLTAVLSTLLIYKHRANIRRLAAGEEPKIGAKA